MTTTYITFGCQYGLPSASGLFDDSHGKVLHPSGYPVSGRGWCEITGCTYEQARAIACALFGEKWAFAYDEDNPPTFDLYPDGCQLHVRISSPIRVPCEFAQTGGICEGVPA